MQRNSIGSPVIRKEGVTKVTGRTRYIDDEPKAGHWYGLTVRSDVAHGTIRQIHFGPGVPWDEIVVVSAKDIPGKNHVALILHDQPFLVENTIRHAEEAILLLAHPEYEVLLRARAAITIDVDPLPAISTLEEAETGMQIVWGEDNLFKEILIQKGDVEAAFRTADHVVEGVYATGAQEQLYIEPNGMIADVKDGEVIIHGSMQCPYYIQKALKELFDLPAEKIRIVQAETGGGFGGKEEFPSILAGHAALLSYKAKKPVRMVYDRAEDMVASTKRHPSRSRHRTAVDKNGKLLAMDISFDLDGGAYATLSAVVLSRGAIHAAGPYSCPNIRIRARAFATNLPPHGAFRGFGAPQSLFAVERQMNKVAAVIGLTPEELRRRNFLQTGQTTATGQKVQEPTDMDGLLTKALAMSDYQKKVADFREHNARSELKKGIGFATFYHGAGFTGSGEKMLASTVVVEATQEGRLKVLSSSTEIGQGTNTVFSQIAADAMGISYDAIDVVQPDTKFVPDSGPTVASRTVMVVGKLVEQATQDIRERLLTGGFWDGKDETTFGAGCTAYIAAHGQLRQSRQYVQPSFVQWNDETYQGDAYVTFAWAVYVAEVTVDPVSFQTTVDDFVAVQDVGQVMHPTFAEGQIEGGVAQAIGYALYEEVVWKDGRMANGNMTNYIMPTSADLPPIRVAFVETPGQHGPGKGARGIGELPMDGAAPAIANALSFALELEIDTIPVTPERLFQLVEKGVQ